MTGVIGMKKYLLSKQYSKELLISILLGGLLGLSLLDLPAQAQSGTYSNNDVTVLAKMIHGEARGESYIGKVAVGAVILNRVEDKKFPGSVYGVCFQPGAFDAVRDGQYYMEPNQESINAAKAALGGWDPTYGALYYWNPDTATSKWIWSRKVLTQIGKHVFGI
jgi:N-acetylmuramoyl-L-alanine amidase